MTFTCGRYWAIGKDQFLHFAFLVVDVRQAGGDGARRESGLLDRAGQLLHRQVAAQALVVHARGQALGGQQGLVLLHVEAAVRLAQAGDVGDLLGDGGIAHGHVAGRDLGVDGAFGDQVVQDGLLGFRGLEHLLVELRAHHLARLVDLAALGFFPFLLGDLLAGHGRHAGGGIAAVLVALETN